MSAEFGSELDVIQQYTPVEWSMIPDFGLYMDQVVSFIIRIFEPLYGETVNGCLSASMINNYVKGKLIPRPIGKKYDRAQIALLIMIVALKQVSSIEEIRRMLTETDGLNTEQLYTHFIQRHKAVLQQLQPKIPADTESLPAPLDLAIVSASYRVGCSALLRRK